MTTHSSTAAWRSRQRGLAGYGPRGHKEVNSTGQPTALSGGLPRRLRGRRACNAGDVVLIPGLGRSPGEGNGNPLQYSCLENRMDRGAWRATVHGITKTGARRKVLAQHGSGEALHPIRSQLCLWYCSTHSFRVSSCNPSPKKSVQPVSLCPPR